MEITKEEMTITNGMGVEGVVKRDNGTTLIYFSISRMEEVRRRREKNNSSNSAMAMNTRATPPHTRTTPTTFFLSFLLMAWGANLAMRQAALLGEVVDAGGQAMCFAQRQVGPNTYTSVSLLSRNDF